MEGMRELVSRDSCDSRLCPDGRLGGVLDSNSERIRSRRPIRAREHVRKARLVVAMGIMVSFFLSTMFIVSNSPSPNTLDKTSPVSSMGVIGDVSWTNMSPSISPDSRYAGVFVYDPPMDTFVLFGGRDIGDYYSFIAYNDTWSYDYDTNSWQNRSPVDTPYAVLPAYAYDPVDEVTLLFGTGPDCLINETWSYSASANLWSNLQPANAPPYRAFSSAAYDSQSDRLVVYGGFADMDRLVIVNETWSYDFKSNAWTNLTVAYSPPPAYAHTMVYDSESDRIIMFGGFSMERGFLNGTWSYDLDSNTWTNRTPLLSPPARNGASTVYDPISDRVLIFGGYAVNEYFEPVTYDDMWEYDYDANSWSEINQLARPPARLLAHMAIDPLTRTIVLYGGGSYDGFGNPVCLGDTWVVQLGAPIPEFQTIVLPAFGIIVAVIALAGLKRRTRCLRRD
jgi:hypothetical protein